MAAVAAVTTPVLAVAATVAFVATDVVFATVVGPLLATVPAVVSVPTTMTFVATAVPAVIVPFPVPPPLVVPPCGLRLLPRTGERGQESAQYRLRVLWPRHIPPHTRPRHLPPQHVGGGSHLLGRFSCHEQDVRLRG
ncbi:hypothetical protein V1L54_14805 [Streptomyces sp. TRM 70361]|uniref:hypothetical protein n=1 Tax=Streptomyces sp. TRM 70361 TaxID=3116553 RepID=UPI002E7BBAD9|nr:hypothetical protein [Streptomyces sp. TRM 70361]MEE1940662.1 hypothetical protein [Streptomyces sp. TRM 70361]